MRLGPQQTFKRTTERPRIRLNRVRMATENDAKEPKSQSQNIFAEDTDLVEIAILDGIFDKKEKIKPEEDTNEDPNKNKQTTIDDEFTNFAKSRSLAR